MTPRVSSPPTTCDGEPITILGTPGHDTIHGTAGPDVIHGQEGNDVILGLGGDDVICDDAGINVLRGGSGDDRLFNTSSADTSRLSGGPGDDLLSLAEPGDCSTTALAAGPVTVDLRAGTAVGEGNDTIVSDRARRSGAQPSTTPCWAGPMMTCSPASAVPISSTVEEVATCITPDNRDGGDDGAVDRVIGGPGGDLVSLMPGAVPT